MLLTPEANDFFPIESSRAIYSKSHDSSERTKRGADETENLTTKTEHKTEHPSSGDAEFYVNTVSRKKLRWAIK
jgi:hypothetical protein